MTAIHVVPTIPEMLAQIPSAPRRPELNAEFRADMIDMGSNDPRTWGAAIKERCKQDKIFWFDTFCWTRDAKWRATEADVPVILYQKQAGYIHFRDGMRLAGKPHCLVKSREQGASLIVCYDNQHEWQFRQGSSKIGSEKKDKVDGKSFETSLLAKTHYNLSRQPAFLMPEGFKLDKPFRTYNPSRFFNPETGKSMEGEATNPNFAVGDRLSNIDIDEATRIRFLSDIQTACANACKAWAFISTPKGWEHFAILVHGGQVQVYKLPWWENEAWFGWTDADGNKQDGLRYCQPGCPVHPEGGKPHSDRFDHECEAYGWDGVKIAQEFDLDFAKSGRAAFDPIVVDKVQKYLQENKPKFHFVSLDFKKPDTVQSAADDHLAWYRETRNWPVIHTYTKSLTHIKVYDPPGYCRDKTCKCGGTGKHIYVFGGDVNKGLEHGDAAIGLMGDITAGRIAASSCSKNMDPEKLAVEWAKLCKWYGIVARVGNCGIAGIENADQGHTVCKILERMGIHQIVYQSEDKIRGKNIADKLGVTIHGTNKSSIITDHMLPQINTVNEYGWPIFYIPDLEFWCEARTFVNDGTDTKPKFRGQGGTLPDDWVMAFVALCYTARMQYRKVKGFVRKNVAEAARNNQHNLQARAA